MPRIGVRQPAVSRATRNIVPSPPKTSIKSVFAAKALAFEQTGVFSPTNWAVLGSVRTDRPCASMNLAACRTSMRPQVFSGFAIKPTRFIFLANFFNQNEKLFVSRGAEDMRFGE